MKAVSILSIKLVVFLTILSELQAISPGKTGVSLGFGSAKLGSAMKTLMNKISGVDLNGKSDFEHGSSNGGKSNSSSNPESAQDSTNSSSLSTHNGGGQGGRGLQSVDDGNSFRNKSDVSMRLNIMRGSAEEAALKGLLSKLDALTDYTCKEVQTQLTGLLAKWGLQTSNATNEKELCCNENSN